MPNGFQGAPSERVDRGMRALLDRVHEAGHEDHQFNLREEVVEVIIRKLPKANPLTELEDILRHNY